MTRIRTFVGVTALLAAAGPTGAATMTFNSLPDEGALLTSYSEAGIIATSTGGTLAYFTSPGALHIDDSGTGLASSVSFATGGLFDAQGFTLTSLGYNFQGTPGPLTDNIFVAGFLGGVMTASASYVLSDILGMVQSIALGSAFGGIDRLDLTLAYPVNTASCDAPCAHFDLNDITLTPADIAPVPLPATGGTLILAGLALAGLRLGRRPARATVAA